MLLHWTKVVKKKAQKCVIIFKKEKEPLLENSTLSDDSKQKMYPLSNFLETQTQQL